MQQFKNADSTENLYIEGDNLEVLKLLRNSYYNKIKMIYIDPPYNTGNDFIYKDDFSKSSIESDIEEGDRDESGKRLILNLKTNSKYHSNWLKMMYPRLKVAKDLLTGDGVVFISIDDNEVDNLRKICDEIYGSSNFIGCLVWEKKKKGAFLNLNITNIKEYILVYSKSINDFNGLIGEINNDMETYPCIKTTNARGVRTIKAGIKSKFKEPNHIEKAGKRISSGNMELILLDDLIIENGILKNQLRIDSNWIYSQSSLDDYAEDGSLYITQDLYLRRVVNDERKKKT